MKLNKPAFLIVMALILAVGAGCSIFSAQPVESQEQSKPAQSASTDKGSTASAKQAPAQAPIGRYYDFDDILVPNQLKLDTKKSLVFRAGKFKAGVLVFSDNLEVQSLINFFVDSMQKDNWSLQGSYKYPKVMLFFAKKGRTCVIEIVESTFSTAVTIWVAPAL